MSWWSKVVDYWTGTEQKQVRTRNSKGQYVADDKSTSGVNEAYTTVRVKKKRGRPKKVK
jgi:hypothetical protein